jgi:hypothetical protein
MTLSGPLLRKKPITKTNTREEKDQRYQGKIIPPIE